ncbi:DNA polymerase III subunit alpha [Hydrogenothermus marinus]|uniref:DNA polymerase III subunit alpha n=1 Tax=Hydrogenothermus marinus TaxID=133270 RepID=A0A3M0BM03_9AQUI|nr:DNA polymerase III subunit alpha [Hydrogenothermus marinus]RMA97309.1 DNA polymerase III alpha subunit [Hydrogenothermus marinus]
MSKDFTHLHLHSHYSLLDGAIKIPELAQKAKEYGYKAVALTDHGNIFGAIEFYQEMKKVGVKPIIGMEAYFANNRFEKKGDGSDSILEDKNYHLILHAKDKTGFKNLMKLSSLAYTEGFYYKPRIDWELLEKYHEGLICQTACLKGFIPHLLSKGKFEEAYQLGKRLKDIFGEDLYFEIQMNGLEEQNIANKGILELAEKLNVKVVATNDSHYLNEEDAEAHDIIKALQMKLTLKELKEKGRAFKVRGLHFTKPEEMYEKFKGYEFALKNTMEIAEKCNVEIETAETRGYLFPKFQIPGLDREATEEEKAQYFEKLAWEGLEKRLENIKDLSAEKHKEYKDRLKYEVEIIKQMGFPEYFLIVQDFIKHAKNNGIPVGPGRGSAAGSLVAYALGITEVDPLQHGLIFERFLNPDRISMPDIDIDFCMENRPKMIEYVKNKYGSDAVAQIITYNFMKSKMVIRDVARVLGFSYSEADKIAKMILPGPTQGSTLTIEENLEANPEFRKLYETDERVKRLLDLAKKLEGSARHTGIHAAGVVIAPGPLDQYVPVYVDKDGTKATQFDMGTLEMLGLVKMDFLGLKTLTELDYMKKLIKERHNVEIDFSKIPLDDPNVFKLLQSGRTTGVFQLESKGMQNLLVKLKPDKFEEIIAVLALYRPGPLNSGMVDEYVERKHGRKKVDYPFEEVKDVLKETYGLVVYQEQIMFMANILSGFTMAEADTLRKAIGKKKADVMAKMKDRFINGAVEKGYDKEKITKLWDDIEKFASYSFNKSHSTAYAYLTYWTAYIKTYYPEEFFAVKLTTEKNDDKFLSILNDMKDFGIELLPPDVNYSYDKFAIEEKGKIRFGLARIKNVGESSAKAIVEEREKNGNYQDIFDTAERLDSKNLNKRVLEALIKAGAFDFTEIDRGILLANIDKALSVGQKNRESKDLGQNSLLGLLMEEDSKPVATISYNEGEKLSEKEKLRFEKEVLGFYISGHPLLAYKKELEGRVLKIASLIERKQKEKVKIAGVISNIKKKKTRTGNTMAVFQLQDETGIVDVRAFPESLEDGSILEEDNLVIVEGTVDINDEQETVSINANNIIPIDSINKDVKYVRFIFSKEDILNGTVEKVRDLCKKYKGDKEVVIEIYDKGNFWCEIAAHSNYHVDISDEFKQELATILEPNQFIFE